MDKQAMIMAAGKGTRLGHLTQNAPKALVHYQGKPLLEHIIQSLVSYGFARIVINVHHFGDQVIRYVSARSSDDVELIISDERDQLLDTGGGLRKAADYFSEGPVLIHNVDILTSADLSLFWQDFQHRNVLVSLMVKQRPTSRLLRFDPDMQLVGWEHTETGEEIVTRACGHLLKLAFSGIYIVDSAFFDVLPNKDVFPIMPEILRISADQPIYGYQHNEDHWRDMGRLSAYA